MYACTCYGVIKSFWILFDLIINFKKDILGTFICGTEVWLMLGTLPEILDMEWLFLKAKPNYHFIML